MILFIYETINRNQKCYTDRKNKKKTGNRLKIVMIDVKTWYQKRLLHKYINIDKHEKKMRTSFIRNQFLLNN